MVEMKVQHLGQLIHLLPCEHLIIMPYFDAYFPGIRGDHNKTELLLTSNSLEMRLKLVWDFSSPRGKLDLKGNLGIGQRNVKVMYCEKKVVIFPTHSLLYSVLDKVKRLVHL